MTKPEFLALVERWSDSWDKQFAAGEPGFGTEEKLEDWLGSIAAWMGIEALLGHQPSDVGLICADWTDVFRTNPSVEDPADEH